MKVPRSPVFFFSATLAAFSIALIAFVVLIFLSQRSVERATAWVNVTLEVKEHLGKLRTDMVAAQAGQVAVLLTGDQRHLTQYYKATTDIGLTLRSLSILVASVPIQTQRVVQLKELFREKIRELDATVQTRARAPSGAAEVGTKTGYHFIRADYRAGWIDGGPVCRC